MSITNEKITYKTHTPNAKPLPRQFPPTLISEMMEYLDTRYPRWMEATISQTSHGRQLVVLHHDRFVAVNIGAQLFEKLEKWSKYIPNWTRITITQPGLIFSLVSYKDVKPGMLLRGASGNTTLFVYIKEVDLGAQTVEADQEGEAYNYSMPENKNYKFTVLREDFPAEAYDEVKWLKRS